MKYAYTNAQMRMFDEKEISRGTSVSVLMQRAGNALAEAVKNALCRLGQRDAVFVCGGGNNGGDGFVAAEVLRGENFEVSVLCLAEHFSDAALAAKSAYKGEIFQKIPRRIFSVTVDCLFGTGLSRPVGGVNADLVDFINSGRYVIACDLPTGLFEGGIAHAPCVKADETLSMGQLKSALILSDGADIAGRISVADIGIPAEGGAEIWEDADVREFFPKKKSNTHKGTYGSVSILAGSERLGASLLSAGAALKSGAGYTQLWLPPSRNSDRDEIRRTVLAANFPAMILNIYGGEPFISNSVAFGMGAGIGATQYEMLERLLLTYESGTLVLDADALNMLASYGMEILKHKKSRVVITPHPKEFSRLTGKSVEELLSDPIEAAKAFSKEYAVTVVFKNNHTVIAEGDRVAINPTGSPVLSKGGSGDVLAGLLAGTLARGVPPFEAAVVSSYLLGRAGEIAAEEGDEYSPDAKDMIGYLSRAIKTVM